MQKVKVERRVTIPMKQLMLGNKAFARGLYEAGCSVVSSYPGTPSTEVTEEILETGIDIIALPPGKKLQNMMRSIVNGLRMKRWPWKLLLEPVLPEKEAFAA